MSQDLKLRFDQMRNNNPAKPVVEKPAEPEEGNRLSHAYGNIRNLRLVWPDGHQSFFNYAYLIRADFSPGDDLNIIHLGFSGQDIKIKGYGLEELFEKLVDHLPRTIAAIDPRYIPVEPVNEIIVTDIVIQE
ncbi:hypothetical protein [Dyadobacter sp. 32]|uniref:hypothetical protein n=1 Tax=Dyadobacter sp. 32 TaxID=538966 RepID=UPI0011EF8999